MIPRIQNNFRATFLQFLFIGFLPLVGVGQLPDFASKVQLHNAGGAEVTEDGQAIHLYRVPAEVREQLSEPNKYSSKTSGDLMKSAAQ